MSDDTLAAYLHEIGKEPLLEKTEEKELADLISAGAEAKQTLAKAENDLICLDEHQIKALERQIKEGEQAKTKFFKSNLRLVVSIAKRYPLPPTMELLDVIQEGNVGLEHAIVKFDAMKGFKFSTYATHWIRQAISRALDMKSHTIKIAGEKAGQLRAELRRTGGEYDSLSTEMQNLHKIASLASLESMIGSSGDTSLGDLTPDTKVDIEGKIVADSEAERLFSKFWAFLSKEEAEAVLDYYGIFTGEKKTYREIGERNGMGADRTRKMVVAAVGKLRMMMPLEEGAEEPEHEPSMTKR